MWAPRHVETILGDGRQVPSVLRHLHTSVALRNEFWAPQHSTGFFPILASNHSDLAFFAGGEQRQPPYCPSGV